MRTLGLIGGTSWHSSIVYYRLINEMAGKRTGTQANPPLILYSLNVELMRENDIDKIKTTYLHIARKLEIAGARAIVICANTPHLVYEYVHDKISIPILHIADAIGMEATRKGYKKLGLLGTRATMKGDFLHKRLKEKFGIETIIPEEDFMDEIHHYIAAELTRGKFTESAKSFFLDHIQLLKEKGAQAVIMGCTELPLLISEEDTDLPLLQSTNLHAKMAVNFIFQKEQTGT
ncbi:aspartate/glutamate racemase family protein [Salinimicrobium sp. TH3]|uniref:aspartate/glutamate racemase family protein n=1 Tax=Salinimicrobium sp. TH3 TaxID=2997342 RepID=UPI0022749E85|nr:amino acid racemase [Salinimicrobium sp. TH3]MCY2688023.1 amino acid racemase [Salinimicrobium sp. TH3]